MIMGELSSVAQSWLVVMTGLAVIALIVTSGIVINQFKPLITKIIKEQQRRQAILCSNREGWREEA